MVLPIPILIILFNLAIQRTGATCFRRDGTVDSSATPCDPTPGAASVCCDSGSSASCLSNGVCQKSSSDPDPLHGSYWVDSCTDSTWSSPVCLGQCSVSFRVLVRSVLIILRKTNFVRAQSGGQQPFLTPCNNFKDLTSAKWCCGLSNNACCGGGSSLILPVPGSHQLPIQANSQGSSPSSTPQVIPVSSPQVSSVTVPPATVTFTPPPSTQSPVQVSSTPVSSPSSTPPPSSSPPQAAESSQSSDPGPTATASGSTTISSEKSLSSAQSSSESSQTPVATTINSILVTTLLSNSLPASSSSPPPTAGKETRKGSSAGFKIGIAIAAIILGLILLGALFWWIRKRQIAKAAASASAALGAEERHEWPGPKPLASPGSEVSVEKSELHSNTSPWAVPLMNLLKIGRAELSGISKVRMSRVGEKERVELHGNEITASQLQEIQRWREERNRQEAQVLAEIVELDGTSRATRSSLVISPALVEDSDGASGVTRSSMIISPPLDEGSDGGRLFMELANGHGVEKSRWG